MNKIIGGCNPLEQVRVFDEKRSEKRIKNYRCNPLEQVRVFDPISDVDDFISCNPLEQVRVFDTGDGRQVSG